MFYQPINLPKFFHKPLLSFLEKCERSVQPFRRYFGHTQKDNLLVSRIRSSLILLDLEEVGADAERTKLNLSHLYLEAMTRIWTWSHSLLCSSSHIYCQILWIRKEWKLYFKRTCPNFCDLFFKK